ncbi:hypothetical protein [Neobacillus drentensis]|uniref:hypothetical protein n=1 Tax=Neobacillus drentensis TaxID=220684 RepID=UPI000AB7B1E6|nr:hypothetical protein [Neobacillus drentensis]
MYWIDWIKNQFGQFNIFSVSMLKRWFFPLHGWLTGAEDKVSDRYCGLFLIRLKKQDC